jgi:transcription initiation factor TFIID subunit 7
MPPDEADSQMLVVDQPVQSEAAITSSALKIDDYIWPHGITPPLRHVRKRRFRKRLSRRAIEVVEEQVEELWKKDLEAEYTNFSAYGAADTILCDVDINVID